MHRMSEVDLLTQITQFFYIYKSRYIELVHVSKLICFVYLLISLLGRGLFRGCFPNAHFKYNKEDDDVLKKSSSSCVMAFGEGKARTSTKPTTNWSVIHSSLSVACC